MLNLKNFRLGRGPQTVACALAVGGLLLSAGAIDDAPLDAAPVEVKYAGDYLIGDSPEIPCDEDMPCWDCETMGNHLCSPPMNSYLDAYNWCDAEYGDDSDEAIDCQIAALEAWHPELIDDLTINASNV